MEKSKDSAAASSKWSLSQYISDDDDSDTSDFRDDSVTTRSKLRSGRFRRSKELKAVVSEQTSEAMTNFKIPKKQGKKAAKALTVGPADVDENGLIIGTSGKILGYLPEQPATSVAPPSLVVEIPMKSKIGNGVYLPIIPATGPGSGQPKAGPSGVGQEGTEKPCQDVGGNAVNPATLASETKP